MQASLAKHAARCTLAVLPTHTTPQLQRKHHISKSNHHNRAIERRTCGNSHQGESYGAHGEFPTFSTQRHRVMCCQRVAICLGVLALLAVPCAADCSWYNCKAWWTGASTPTQAPKPAATTIAPTPTPTTTQCPALSKFAADDLETKWNMRFYGNGAALQQCSIALKAYTYELILESCR